MKNLQKLHIPIGILIVIAIFASCTAEKKLSKGWYTHKQITRAGYKCEPFKGRQYIRPTKDSLAANIVRFK